nr:hypothetical protein GCM10025732_57040 [Glycomyces mayteni]
MPQPSDDVAADRYLAAEAALSAAGFSWYEVSNWAKNDTARCRHNLLYWEGGHWWGAGPGAHSHLPGVRWWNHKHPSTYGTALAQGLPVAGHETLTDDDRYLERVLLLTRLASGLPSPNCAPTAAPPPNALRPKDSPTSRTTGSSSRSAVASSPTPW